MTLGVPMGNTWGILMPTSQQGASLMATHMEVVNSWARGSTKPSKGYAMFHDGTGIIFSWGHHFPIAKRVATRAGVVVLMTTRDYSKSTSKHKSYTWRGIRRLGLKAFHVPMVLHLAGGNNEDLHLINVNSYKVRIKEAEEKATRARTYKQHWLDRKAELEAELADYMATFNLSEDCKLPADGSQDARLGYWDSEWQCTIIEHYIPYVEDMLALEGAFYGDWTVTAGEKR